MRAYSFFGLFYIISFWEFLKSNRFINTGLTVASESRSNTYAAPCRYFCVKCVEYAFYEAKTSYGLTLRYQAR